MEIHSILGHNLSTLKAVQKLLEQFIVADVSEDGKLDFHEFCSMLKLKRGSKQSERIYAVFNDGEAIDFRHFALVIASCSVQGKTNTYKKNIAFELCDEASKGYLCENSFRKSFQGGSDSPVLHSEKKLSDLVPLAKLHKDAAPHNELRISKQVFAELVSADNNIADIILETHGFRLLLT
mmetsp:Transcript_8469/g.10157  ORF Transcript_8469/g.10157 Transcript_8469/m.10157 type:complete len:180 (+) Transcript_8469:785-1324(+)